MSIHLYMSDVGRLSWKIWKTHHNVTAIEWFECHVTFTSTCGLRTECEVSRRDGSKIQFGALRRFRKQNKCGNFKLQDFFKLVEQCNTHEASWHAWYGYLWFGDVEHDKHDKVTVHFVPTPSSHARRSKELVLFVDTLDLPSCPPKFEKRLWM